MESIRLPLAYRASVATVSAMVTTRLTSDSQIFNYMTLQLTTEINGEIVTRRSVLNWFCLLVLISDWAQTLQKKKKRRIFCTLLRKKQFFHILRRKMYGVMKVIRDQMIFLAVLACHNAHAHIPHFVFLKQRNYQYSTPPICAAI